MALIKDMSKWMRKFPLVITDVNNDSAIVFNLVSVYDCIALCNLSAQSTSVQLRLIFTPHASMTPDRFGPTI